MIPFRPTSSENLALIEKLKATLRNLPMGETLGYPAINKIVGFNIQTNRRHLLIRAIEAVEKELGCCFETVRDIGIQRLTSESIPDVGLAAVRRARRAARRGKKRLDRVNVNSLEPSQHRRVIGYSAMLGAVALVADGRKALAIAAVADPAKPIPPANILDMFRAT